MKKNYVTIISLLIICLAAFIYVSSSRNAGLDPQRLHAYVNPADLQSITLARGKLTLELKPDDKQWYMHVRNSRIEVDADAMLKLMEFINTAKLIRRITKKPEIYSRFNLDAENVFTITLQTDMERSTLYLGKDKDQVSQFVRLPDNPAVYLASQALNLGPEPWHWYYRHILHYEPEMLDHILYNCGQQTLKLQLDDTTGFSAKDAPEGKISADLGQLATYFNGLQIADYVPREGAPQSLELAAHTLHFKDGSSATLRFLDRDEEKDSPPFLDIVFGDTEPSDKKLQYAKSICADYIFSLSWIDKSKYQKSCEDFFIDTPSGSLADKNPNAMTE